MSSPATPVTASGIIAQLEADAAAWWATVKAEGIAIEQALVPVIETGLATLAKDFGTLAVQTVGKLMTAEFSALTGSEKHGQTVTTIVQAAEAAGKAVALSDAQALATNAFVAVTGTAPTA